jgi:hypothetical protein
VLTFNQQWLFIIEGSISFFFSLAVIPFIPDYPLFTKRWWLNRDHQIMAVGFSSADIVEP